MTYVAVGLFVVFIAYALWEGTRSNPRNGTKARDSTGVTGIGDGPGSP